MKRVEQTIVFQNKHLCSCKCIFTIFITILVSFVAMFRYIYVRFEQYITITLVIQGYEISELSSYRVDRYTFTFARHSLTLKLLCIVIYLFLLLYINN